MSKYNRKKHCRCCKQQVEKVSKYAGGVCQPCEEHLFAKRTGAGLAFVLPKLCPGPGVKMTAEQVASSNGLCN